jgi:hypothetical protein
MNSTTDSRPGSAKKPPTPDRKELHQGRQLCYYYKRVSFLLPHLLEILSAVRDGREGGRGEGKGMLG